MQALVWGKAGQAWRVYLPLWDSKGAEDNGVFFIHPVCDQRDVFIHITGIQGTRESSIMKLEFYQIFKSWRCVANLSWIGRSHRELEWGLWFSSIFIQGCMHSLTDSSSLGCQTCQSEGLTHPGQLQLQLQKTLRLS